MKLGELKPPGLAMVDDEDAFPVCLLFAWSGLSRLIFVDEEILSLVAWSGVSPMRQNFCVEDTTAIKPSRNRLT
jgi:hypothetical protein